MWTYRTLFIHHQIMNFGIISSLGLLHMSDAAKIIRVQVCVSVHFHFSWDTSKRETPESYGNFI